MFESRYVLYKLGSKPKIWIVSWRHVAVIDANNRFVRLPSLSTMLNVLNLIRPTVGLPAFNVGSTMLGLVGFHSHETPVAPNP